jgi:hypothetical protein
MTYCFQPGDLVRFWDPEFGYQLGVVIRSPVTAHFPNLPLSAKNEHCTEILTDVKTKIMFSSALTMVRQVE